MANLHAKISLLVLFSIFFVITNCEKKPEDNLNVPQEAKDFNPFGKSDPYMEPNFFQKIGSHIARGWHGFRGLFGRRSNRREENIYKNGAFEGKEGKEEYQPPFEKESTNKEYPEFGNNNNNNNYGNGFSGENQGQEQGQSFQGNQKGNQEEIGFINERQKDKEPKDGKKDGFEDFSGNSGKSLDLKNGENKKLVDEPKSSKPGDNFEAAFGKQNAPNAKARKARNIFGGGRPRLPIRQPFRQPFRPPFRQPFRRPGVLDRFRG